MTDTLDLLAAIVADPSSIGSVFIEQLGYYTSLTNQILAAGVMEQDTLTRAALVGLYLDLKQNPATYVQQITPTAPPSNGFSIRDIVTLPQRLTQTTDNTEDIDTATLPTKIPMIVEIASIGFEARPDLVAVAETATVDGPSDTTQVLRAFVAGFRGYKDSPDNSDGTPVLNTILSLLLERGIDCSSILWNNWFNGTPWTAVMAAPIAQPTIGEIPPLPADACDQEAINPTPSEPVQVLPPPQPSGSGSGSGSGATGGVGPNQNLWALAIPPEIQEAISALFYVKSIFRTKAAKLVYVPIQQTDSTNVQTFLGQTCYAEKTTWNNYVLGCNPCPTAVEGPLLSKKLYTLGLGEREKLRSIVSDELLISLSEKIPLTLVPWDRSTQLTPSDMYVLKPIPNLGVAISMRVRIYQVKPNVTAFERNSAELALLPTLRAVLSPADVVTFTPDPLLCVAKSTKTPPGIQGSNISSNLTLNSQQVNNPTSSATPGLTLFQGALYKSLQVALGPSFIKPTLLASRAAGQAWIRTLAPSRTAKKVTFPLENAPPETLIEYYRTFDPTTTLRNSITPERLQLLVPITIPIPLGRREPTSLPAFLAWVEEKLFSFTSYRTPASRATLAPAVPRPTKVYLGLIPPLQSAVASFLASYQVLRREGLVTQAQSTSRSFGLPRESQLTYPQSYLVANFVDSP